MVTILDAPSLAWRTQDRLSPTTDSEVLHERIGRVKDEEVALADLVVTVSSFAARSYVAAGVPVDRVLAIPLGADVELFRPPPHATSRASGVVALFAGAAIVRKGFDVLLEAFASAVRGGATLTLRVAGPPGDASPALDRLDETVRGRIELLGPLSQSALADEMARADVLVLPSRHDSYGMVVPEALACGLPVIASERVGAAELLVREGETGWIVAAEDVGGLAARLAWCAAQPAALRAMAPTCRAAVAAADWSSYQQRFVSTLGEAIARVRRR